MAVPRSVLWGTRDFCVLRCILSLSIFLYSWFSCLTSFRCIIYIAIPLIERPLVVPHALYPRTCIIFLPSFLSRGLILVLVTDFHFGQLLSYCERPEHFEVDDRVVRTA